MFIVRSIRSTQIIYTYKHCVPTWEETHYVSAAKTSRLILLRETVAVYCENYGTQIIYKDSVRASQETHYVSATRTSRLMLFREIIAVYYENHTKHISTLCGAKRKMFRF
jgi:hypothetical protein